MSLFGSTSNQSKPFSLFGNNTQSNQQPSTQSSGSSLFGNTSQNPPASSAQNSGGLFGNTQSSQQQQPAGSLFGGAQTSQQQPSGGLFANTAGTQAGSLFGNTQGAPQQQQPQQQQQQQQSQPQLGASLFGSSIVNNNAQNGQQQTSGPLQQAGQGQPAGLGESRTSAHFDSLLERGKKRKGPTSNGAQFGELPSLQLSLGDIAGRVRNLGGTNTVSTSRDRDGRARDLLAASGVPRGSTVRDLHAMSASTGTLPPVSRPESDTDIESYVANLRAKSTQDLIDESLEQTKREFNAFLEENIQMNWLEQRQRIHEHFGLAKPAEPQDDSTAGTSDRGAFGRSSGRGLDRSFGASAMSRSVLGGSVSRNNMRQSLFTDVAEKNASGPMPSVSDDPSLRTKQDKYAGKVRELNASRKQGVVYPVIEEFARVEMEAGSDATQHLIDGYRALRDIVGERNDTRDPSDVGAIRERQYAQDYLDENAPAAKAISMKRQIIDGSRRFLESQSFQQIESAVSRNPQEANLGGIPSKINKLRAYLRIRAARKDLGGENAELTMVGDDYCWALIFHLLRCGLVTEATQYVSQNERAIKSMDRNFPTYLAAFARDGDMRLPRDMQTRINSEYSQRTRLAPDNSIDPYRMACYKIVGRCDLSHKNIEGITMSMEDWLWLLFSLAREVNRVEESAGEYFGLDDLRVVIEQIGQRHFTAGGDSTNGYATFFMMQIMAGMFEKAVAYLYPHNYVAAVHVAIALDFYGMLRVADFSVSDSELLTYTTRSQPQISFGRLIGYYTRDFRMARAEAAADYLTLLCLNADLPGAAGESQSEVCKQALKELVLETREFSVLLGDLQVNGQRIKGAIEERLPLIVLKDQQDFLRTLTVQAAAVADDAGRINDATLLYYLAEEYDTVLTVLSRALSDHVSQDLGQDPFALQPQPQQNPENPPDHNSTVSLLTASNPDTLARTVTNLYDRNPLVWSKVRGGSQDTLNKLLKVSRVRSLIQRSETATALDAVLELQIIPLRAEGNISLIRSAAQNFNILPQVVARCIGNLLIWTIASLGAERQKLMESDFPNVRGQAESYVMAARDAMVFAGLIRYKLPADVVELLARAGQSVGA